jgi:hypothetical protein
MNFRCLSCLRCSKMVKIASYVQHLKEIHGTSGYDCEPEGHIYSYSKSVDNFYEGLFPYFATVV